MPNSFPGGVQVATYIPPEIVRKIDAAARAMGLSRAAWVRTTLIGILAADQEQVA